jgi:enoyl-[acyl-carrier protein] reductase I
LGILQGKKGIIIGVANRRSIAWGIAKAVHREGAELGLSYQGEPLIKRVKPLADSIGVDFLEPLDASDDQQLDSFFEKVKDKWGKIDFLVHSIAYASREALKGQFIDTSREDFQKALDVSAYSFVAMANRAVPLMNEGSSLLSISYIGAIRAVPRYNVMGVAKAALEAATRYLALDLGNQNIRVNVISAGPMRTLAASGVSGFTKYLNVYGQSSILGRNVNQDEVGNSSVYLLSDLSSGVTGEVHYVDAGYNIVGVTPRHE